MDLESQSRGGAAVCVLATAGGDELDACLESVCAHTPADVSVVVACGDGDAAAVSAVAERVAPGRALAIQAAGAATVAAALQPADVAFCDGRHRVGPGWLDALRRAAASDGTIATASALTTRGGPTAIDADVADADAAAAAVLRLARPTWPRLERPATACFYVRRSALELAGPLDDGFSERCSNAGLLHVAADDVLVAAPRHVEAPEPPPAEPMERLTARRAALRPLDRALTLARRATRGLSVTVDGRVLTGARTGTQVHALELIAALHRTGAVRLRVVLPPDTGAHESAVLGSLDHVELLANADVGPATPRTAIVHRPFQVSRPHDLLLLRAVGERLVLTHLDLLGYHNRGYHAGHQAWEAHRRLTQEALGAADAVVVLSEHTGRDLRAEELVPADRLHVVSAGAEELVRPSTEPARRPVGIDALGDRPFLLCLGTDLRHKNRPFALEVVAALRRRGWDGALVLAGPHVEPGSSRAHEARRLAAGDLRDAVIDLGAVDEAAKLWLYRHAAAVIYPTTYEGFGFIPFEAAEAGTPCLFAAQSALADALPPSAALLVPWDADASAQCALPVLTDSRAARRHVDEVRAGAERLTWDRTAARLVDVYEDALRQPAREAAGLAWTALEADDRRGHFEGLYSQLFNGIGPTGHALVGEGRLLPEDAQRVLAGLLRRRATRGATLAALRALGRASRG